MLPPYPHISRESCWCAPYIYDEEESVSVEVFPGIYFTRGIAHRVLIHFDEIMLKRRHKHPRQVRSYP